MKISLLSPNKSRAEAVIGNRQAMRRLFKHAGRHLLIEQDESRRENNDQQAGGKPREEQFGFR